MSTQHFLKDPNATLDYTIDWSAWLDDDTIATSTWTASDGITVADEANTTTAATVWLSGGTVGATYPVINRITTAAGRTEDRSLYIRVINR
jgi:hypothetical protein